MSSVRGSSPSISHGGRSDCARGPGLYFFRTDEGGIGRTARRFARTLDPVFQTLGERWQGPPLNGGLIIMSGLTVAIFLAAVIVDLLGY